MTQQLEFSLKINDRFVDSSNAVVRNFALTESIVKEFPVLKLDIIFYEEFLTETIIQDGSPIVITMNQDTNANEKEVMNFRVYHFRASYPGNAGCLEYEITAYHENMWKLNTMCNSYYKGISSDVIKQICSNLKIKSNIDTTNDNQVWFDPAGSYLHFIRDIAIHGYLNNMSVMFWWVDRVGTVNYKNFTQLIQTNPLWRLSETTSLVRTEDDHNVIVWGSVFYNEGGINNFTNGYGEKSTRFNIVTNEDKEENPKLFFNHSDVANIYKDHSSIRWYNQGLDCGNVHENYYLAEEQNKRGRTLWSFSIDCVDSYANRIKLGDCVYYEFKMDGKESIEMYSGNYIVVGIVTSISDNNQAVTQLTLVRQGYTGAQSGEG